MQKCKVCKKKVKKEETNKAGSALNWEGLAYYSLSQKDVVCNECFDFFVLHWS